MVAALSLPLASCDQLPFIGAKPKPQEKMCPRPGIPAAQQGFNEQEHAIRHLRRLAFQNDFFAQLELGRRYSAERAVDKNIEDPIEAAVWYALALSNLEGYALPHGVARGGAAGRGQGRSAYDDCRAYERQLAYRTLNDHLARMSTSEQQKVRDRVVYILSTMGADGYRTLARIYDVTYGPFGEPADDPQARAAMGRDAPRGARAGLVSASSLFPRNDVDAYLYNYLAFQTGDVGAYVLMQDFARSSPGRHQHAAFVEAKAKRWVPPYEFYPPEAPQSGVPHSDESRPRGDVNEMALARIQELPFVHVGRAMTYLGITPAPVADPSKLTKREIETLEAMLGRPMQGRLDAVERVRAIQLAAVNGSSQAQLVLAVMYAEGVGVPSDYARAFHWFSEADRQGSPEAKFAMSTYFSLGVAGVADQDKAAAVVHRMDSALSGFRPSVMRIQGVLSHVSRTPRENSR